TNPKHLVAAWIELFPATTALTTGAVGYASSKDGGGSWQTAFLDTPEFQLAFDPSLVADSSGNLYLACAGANFDETGFLVLETHILLFKSTDGGKTFFR